MRFIIQFISFFIKKRKDIKINEKISLKGSEKILIIKLDEIGDFILSLPLARELKTAFPNIKIDLLTKDNVKNIEETCPYFSKTYFLKNKLFKKNIANKIYLFFYSTLFSISILRKEKYDIVIIPRWDTESSFAVFFAYFSRAKIRLTYSENSTALKRIYNKNCDYFYTHLAVDKELKHEVEKTFFLLGLFNISPKRKELELWLLHEDHMNVKGLISSFDESNIIAVCPAASHERRKWKYENYQAVITWLILEYDFNVVIIGGGEDVNKFTFKSPKENKLIDFRGKLTLRETAALLKKSFLYIGNDTGPMHIAAAAGTKVIEISSQPIKADIHYSLSPKRFAPWGVEFILAQPQTTVKPCPDDKCVSKYSHCINNVLANEVKLIVVKLLDLK